MIIRPFEEKDKENVRFVCLNSEGPCQMTPDESHYILTTYCNYYIENEGHNCFVAADEDDSVMGYAFCIFQQHTDSNIMTDIKTLYIDDLCVDENIRGRHIGSSLYNAVLDFARENGCYNVTLNVWSCNTSAIKFYEKMGLVPQKIGMEKIL